LSTMKHELLESRINAMQEDIREIKDVLHARYVSQDQFAPVKNVVYGMVGLIMATVVGAIMALLFKS